MKPSTPASPLFASASRALPVRANLRAGATESRVKNREELLK